MTETSKGMWVSPRLPLALSVGVNTSTPHLDRGNRFTVPMPSARTGNYKILLTKRAFAMRRKINVGV